MRARRLPGLVAGAVLLLALSACDGADDDPEELVAVPFPREAEDVRVGGDETGDAEAGETEAAAVSHDVGGVDVAGEDAEGTDRAAETGVHDDVLADGPPLAVVSDHLAERVDGAVRHDHLLADLTDDGTVELVIAAVSVRGEGVVEVARWADDALEVTATVHVGDADDLDRLRLSQVGVAGASMLVLPVRHQGTTRVVMLEPSVDGELRVPGACPIDDAGTLRSVLGSTLTLVCDGDAAPGGDALVWRDGAFTPTDDMAQVRGATDVATAVGIEER